MSDCNEISGDFSVSQDLVDNVERLTDRISELISLFKDKKDKLSPIKTAESLQESELKYESDTKDSEIHRLMTEIAEVKVSIICKFFILYKLYTKKKTINFFYQESKKFTVGLNIIILGIDGRRTSKKRNFFAKNGGRFGLTKK